MIERWCAANTVVRSSATSGPQAFGGAADEVLEFIRDLWSTLLPAGADSRQTLHAKFPLFFLYLEALQPWMVDSPTFKTFEYCCNNR